MRPRSCRRRRRNCRGWSTAFSSARCKRLFRRVKALPVPALAPTATAPQQMPRTGKKPEDGEEYLSAADEIAEHANAFVKAYDGSQFADLDEIIEETPAHYSQQYKQKYGEEN